MIESVGGPKDDEQVIFVATLERYLSEEIAKCSAKCDNKLNRATILEFKSTVKNCFLTVFSKSNIKLSMVSIDWVAIEYFKHISINGTQKLGEMLVVYQDSVKSLPSSDVEMLIRLLKDTEVGDKLERERAN